MYHVPPSRNADDANLISREGRCPRCGSRRQLPSDAGWGLRQLPRTMQILICADCGARYRIVEAMPTWRDLGQDIVFYIGASIVLALIIVLLL